MWWFHAQPQPTHFCLNNECWKKKGCHGVMHYFEKFANVYLSKRKNVGFPASQTNSAYLA